MCHRILYSLLDAFDELQATYEIDWVDWHGVDCGNWKIDRLNRN